jgi:hypothetical protein
VHSVDAVPDSLRDAEIALERTRADAARRVLGVEDLDLHADRHRALERSPHAQG